MKSSLLGLAAVLAYGALSHAGDATTQPPSRLTFDLPPLQPPHVAFDLPPLQPPHLA